QVCICRSTVLPSSTWSLAPAGRLSPSGNCTMARGGWVSPGTRMLTRTLTCPVLVSTAVCSIAHSSGASRLTLEQRTAQPGGGAAGAEPAAGGAACAGATCAVLLDLG